MYCFLHEADIIDARSDKRGKDEKGTSPPRERKVPVKHRYRKAGIRHGYDRMINKGCYSSPDKELR